MRWIFLLLPITLWAGQLRHTYATWEENPTHTIALHFHGIETEPELTLHYDCEPHYSKLDEYRCQVKVPLYKKYRNGRCIYHLNLTDLEPGTTYYFSIAERNRPLGPERCVQTLAEKPPYRFIEGGDWENTEAAAMLAGVAASYEPDGMWLGGDYPTGVITSRDDALWDAWLDMYLKIVVGKGGRLIPLVMAVGNHEVVGGFGKSPKEAPFFFDYFRPDQTSYYSLPIGEKARLFVLDSGHAAAHSGAQATWLEKELQKAEATPLKIAMYHVPLYPSVRFTEKGVLFRLLVRSLKAMGYHEPQRRLFSFASLWGQKHWLPLFDAYQLTVAFEHHDQALKRTHPLKNGHKDPTGTVYLGDGGFGPKKQFPPLKGLKDPQIAKVKGKTPFFWLVEFSSKECSCRAISTEGESLDYCQFSY